MSTTRPTRAGRFTAITLALLTALAVVPVTAATAATNYVPDVPAGINVVNPGGSGEQHVVVFSDGSFDAGTTVSIRVEGPAQAVLSVFRAANGVELSKTASATGAVTFSVDVPDNAPGNYFVIGKGTLGNEHIEYSASLTAVSDGITDGDIAETGGPDDAVAETDDTAVAETGTAAAGTNTPAVQTATVNGNAVSGPATVAYPANSFLAGEQVIFTVTGSGTATLSVLRAATVTFTKTADAVTGAVSVTVTLPANATGNYVLTAKGASSGFVQAPVTLGELASTGFAVPQLLVWAAAGVLLLGLALVIVQRAARRRATAVTAR